MSSRTTSHHPFHIVNPSPWPRLTAFAAFFIVTGLTLTRHSFAGGSTLFFLGFVAVVLFASLWWRDIVREATYEGHHTLAVQHGLRFGRILFIVSEVRLFFAFFWAYFHVSLNPAPSLGAVWPPIGIEARSPWAIPLLNTALLLTSGAALTWSHAALLGGFRLEAITGLIVTLILATVFTALQVFEYLNASFSISDSVFGSTFYRLTGLHGFHVIIGTLFLGVALYRLVRGHYTISNHIGYEAGAWYWHFVDVVWLGLYLAVYVWGNGGTPADLSV